MRLSPHAKTFLLFFGLQFISYLNITFDMIAVNHAWYGVASMTNMLAPLIAWMMVHQVAHSEEKWTRIVGMVAVSLGGWSSTMLGMWIAGRFFK